MAIKHTFICRSADVAAFVFYMADTKRTEERQDAFLHRSFIIDQIQTRKQSRLQALKQWLFVKSVISWDANETASFTQRHVIKVNI